MTGIGKNIISNVSKNHISRQDSPVPVSFKDVLGIDLGEIGVLCKCVNIRNDIVHYNGKTKSGDKISIERNEIEELAKAVGDMIENVESQIVASPNEKIQ